MVYSDRYKFIFLAIPKTGSRSIQDYLQHFGRRSRKGWSPNHDNYEQTKKELGDKVFEECFKFTFFRNPWSLLVSTFFYNRHKFNLPPDKRSVIYWLDTYRGADSYAPYLYDKEGNLALDFIGKLEHIDENLKTVCEKIKIPVPGKLPQTGKQDVRGRLHYTEYYEDIRLRERIGEIFAKSNEILKYEFNDTGR